MPRNKWQWKHDNSKHTRHSESNAKGKFIAIQAYLKKQKRHQIKNLTLFLKQLEKEGFFKQLGKEKKS